MQTDRLLEAALGRPGLQLHDGLARRELPTTGESLTPPIPRNETYGWRITWPDRPRGRRLAVAATLLDPNGDRRRADGPFVDAKGRFLWCRALDERPLYIPKFGVPAGTSTLQLSVFALGRGPARPMGHCTAQLPPTPGLPWEASAWADPVLVLAVALIHADGVVRSSERHALRGLVEQLGLGDHVDLDATLARPTPASLDRAVAQAKERLGGWGPRTLLEKLVMVAVANGCPTVPERAMLVEIAFRLGASKQTVEHLLRGWSRPGLSHTPDLSEARSLLGVPSGASRDALKQAWKAQMREHHPDRVPDDDIEARVMATARSAALNAAYELLLEHGSTGDPAPPRATAPLDEDLEDELPLSELPPTPPQRPRLQSWQIGMGFLALALLAFAVGLAVNSHVELALASVAGGP